MEEKIEAINQELRDQKFVMENIDSTLEGIRRDLISASKQFKMGILPTIIGLFKRNK